VVATLLLVLATLVRLEYSLVLAGYLLALLRRFTRRGREKFIAREAFGWVAAPLVLMLLALTLFTLFRMSGLGSASGRAWFAFRQHYAVQQVVSGRSTIDPWIDYQVLAEQVFPGCSSLTDALRTRPHEVLAHIFTNLTRVSSSVGHFLQPTPTLTSWIALGPLSLVAGLSFGGLLILMRGSGLKSVTRELWSGSRNVLQLSLLGPLAVLPGLLIYSKPMYLLPLVPLLFGFLGMSLVCVVRALEFRYPKIGIAKALHTMSAAAATAVMLVAVGARGDLHQPSEQRNLRALRLLEDVVPDRAVKLLGLDQAAYCDYLGWERCEKVSMVAATTGASRAIRHDLSTLIATHAPDIIWIDDRIIGSLSFEPASLDVLNSDGWLMQSLSGSRMFFRAAVGFRDKVPVAGLEAPDGFSVADDLRVELGPGWYDFEPHSSLRWMRSPATLFISAARRARATLSIRTALVFEAGGIGSRGRLAVEVADGTSQVIPVRVNAPSEVVLPLDRGWNRVTLRLEAGCFTPSIATPPSPDHRSLSIAFAAIGIFSDRPQQDPPGFTSSRDLEIKLDDGWYLFEPSPGVRWMQSPGRLMLWADDHASARLTLSPYLINQDRDFGSVGTLELRINEVPQGSFAVEVGTDLIVDVVLKSGWNSLQLKLAAGNFIPKEHLPNTTDVRSLAIAFERIELRSTRRSESGSG
jgi:hypothetical protein